MSKFKSVPFKCPVNRFFTKEILEGCVHKCTTRDLITDAEITACGCYSDMVYGNILCC